MCLTPACHTSFQLGLHPCHLPPALHGVRTALLCPTLPHVFYPLPRLPALTCKTCSLLQKGTGQLTSPLVMSFTDWQPPDQPKDALSSCSMPSVEHSQPRLSCFPYSAIAALASFFCAGDTRLSGMLSSNLCHAAVWMATAPMSAEQQGVQRLMTSAACLIYAVAKVHCQFEKVIAPRLALS